MLLDQKRIAKNLKINELASKLGIDSSLMSRILANKRKPTKHQLYILAKELEIDYNELLTYYLAEEIVDLIKGYPEIANEILTVAEERVSYLQSTKFMTTINYSTKIDASLTRINQLKTRWNSCKPLDNVQLQKMEEYFNTSYTFESNRIEGNTLTLQETHLVINEGITIGGKSMREHLEVVNHKEAIELVKDLVRQKVPFNSYHLKQLHQLILKGVDDRNAGVYRTVPVRISGSAHVPPEPYLIDQMMEDYFVFYQTRRTYLHPIILAAEMHERLVTIHPFVDGNGRTARLVMNLILLQHGFTIANLKGSLDDRMRYYHALEQVQVNHKNESFYALITEHVELSLEEHLHLAGVN